MIKRLLLSGFKKLGYQLHKVEKNKEMSMEGALRRCIQRGLNVNSVIDVGASDGRWSRMCVNLLPNAHYLLIEAQYPHKNGLEIFKAENPNVDFIISAAGSREGQIYFDNSALFGGLASEVPFEKNCITVPVVTIDNEIKKRKLQPPFLIKLDTHGFEVPIIEGALDALKFAELLIIETYNYKLTENSLKYFQMCDFLDKLGFSPIELVDFKLREHDNTFWQMDTFFVRSNRVEFSYNSYQ